MRLYNLATEFPPEEVLIGLEEDMALAAADLTDAFFVFWSFDLVDDANALVFWMMGSSSSSSESYSDSSSSNSESDPPRSESSDDGTATTCCDRCVMD
jgi:hypothetical protein